MVFNGDNPYIHSTIILLEAIFYLCTCTHISWKSGLKCMRVGGGGAHANRKSKVLQVKRIKMLKHVGMKVP